MSTSFLHPHRKLYLREIEEAFEVFKGLKKDDFYNIPKITWWILKYEELYEYSHNHRHVGSCIDGMGCACCWDAPESRFSSLYSSLQDVVELYKHEKYFKEENVIFDQVKDDHPALMQWLKKNEALGSEEFLLFWMEWYREDRNDVRPYIMSWPIHDIQFKGEEWKNTIRFCEVFNELYWTSDVCPRI